VAAELDVAADIRAPAIDEGLEALAARLARITVLVARGPSGHGCGVVWRRDGLIVTNAHVAHGPATVILADGRRLAARLVARDPRRDLAALRVAADDLEVAEPAGSEGLAPGALVASLGHPWGIRGAISVGILHELDAAGARGSLLRAHLRLAPGNSGGPLADARGRVIGINAMIAEGLALAIPTRAVERFLADAEL